MNKMRIHCLLFLVCLLGVVSPAVAGIPGAQAAILKGDFTRAFKEFKKEAEKGNPLAMAPVAVMLHFGQGTKQDLKQAFAWYLKAAKKGYEAGMANVGIMYYKGAGTPQNDVKAYAWLDLASRARGGREHNAKARVAGFLSAKQLKQAQQLALSLRKQFHIK